MLIGWMLAGLTALLTALAAAALEPQPAAAAAGDGRRGPPGPGVRLTPPGALNPGASRRPPTRHGGPADAEPPVRACTREWRT